MEKLPVNLFTVTMEQVELLKIDNICERDAIKVAEEFGVVLNSAEDVLPKYMN